MLDKLKLHIDKNFSFIKEKKLFLAISGGIDSMILLDLFHQLKFDIAVLHCNFTLRDSESDADEIFVKSTCNSLNIPIFIQKFNTKQFAADYKLSIQFAARKLRYDWFNEQLNEKKFDYIVTAHHLDDSLETFIINLTRGTGLDGLTGIPAQNDKIIRPLLLFSRSEIERYANANKIAWREDSSNLSDQYLRNKLRHDVIPVLKEVQPALLTSFKNTLNYLQQAQSLVEDASKIVYKIVVFESTKQLKINLIELLKLPNYQAYLYYWLKDFGFTAWEDIYELIKAQSGKKVYSKNYVLLKDRNILILYQIENAKNDKEFFIQKNQIEVKIPLNLILCKASVISEVANNCIFVDESKLQFPLKVRKWEDGDYFYPFGMAGKKKLSKFFKDDKMSLFDKSNQWLLCSENEIIWIINKRLDERFKVTSTTTNILKITVL